MSKMYLISNLYRPLGQQSFHRPRVVHAATYFSTSRLKPYSNLPTPTNILSSHKVKQHKSRQPGEDPQASVAKQRHSMNLQTCIHICNIVQALRFIAPEVKPIVPNELTFPVFRVHVTVVPRRSSMSLHP
jgi:hypothetical protein